MDILPFRQVGMSDVLRMDQNDHFASTPDSLLHMRVLPYTHTHTSFLCFTLTLWCPLTVVILLIKLNDHYSHWALTFKPFAEYSGNRIPVQRVNAGKS